MEGRASHFRDNDCWKGPDWCSENLDNSRKTLWSWDYTSEVGASPSCCFYQVLEGKAACLTLVSQDL